MPEKRRASPGRTGTWWREAAVVAIAVLLSSVVLCVAHYYGDPLWVRRHLDPVPGSDAALWQVQTTFLSVGFAGLAIAAQLFADAPLAIGASRGRVLAYIGAGWFVIVGLVANAVMAIETIWLPSATGVVIAFAWFVATAVLLLVSTSRLTQLFGHPSRLDEVVRSSLVDTLSDRLDQMARRYADARKGLDGLLTSESASRTSTRSVSTLKVPVPETGRVVRAIKPKGVRQAIASLGLSASGRGSADDGPADEYVSPRIVLDVRPGERTRLGDAAFRVVTSERLNTATASRIIRLLQSSIELEPPGAVTPYEETEHEIASLKDAIGANLRSGSLATAERALELLGHVVRGVWVTELDRSVESKRAPLARGSGLLQSIVEVEQDVLLSPQVALVFVNAAMTRALESPGTGSAEYVDECLRSFTRQWSDILRHGGPEFEALPVRIVMCVQNLAAYSSPSLSEHQGLRSRGVWAMVELVKLALDAQRADIANMAAGELRRLFELDPEGPARSEVRAGLLVLSGWLRYLASTNDQRYPADMSLEETLVSDGSWRDIVAARDIVDGGTPFSRWDMWETNSTASGSVQASELPDFIDRAQLTALAGSSGTLPTATDQETATEYARLLRLIPDATRGMDPGEGLLRERLEAEIERWDSAGSDRHPRPSSAALPVASLAGPLREALNERERIADRIPAGGEMPANAHDSRSLLALSFRIPRRYFVGEAVDPTRSHPETLGRMIADAFTEAEDRKIIGELRALQNSVLGPTAPAIRHVVEVLRDGESGFVLLTPYGDDEGWTHGYPADVREALDSVTRIETGALDDEVVLFEPRTTLRCSRRPEEKAGIAQVEGTAIALGLFEDGDESLLRVEAAEHFLIWPAEDPRVFRLAVASGAAQRR